MEDTRVPPPFVADERAMLENWLAFQRQTLEWKCAGLTPQQLCERSVPPAGMSLAGLVRHMAEVERSWFRRVLTGEDAPAIFYTEAEPDDDFFAASPATVHADFAVWRAEVERAVSNAAAVDSLDAVGVQQRQGHDVSLRWILVHMIEEYARHNGHADFLRERIDGATGD